MLSSPGAATLRHGRHWTDFDTDGAQRSQGAIRTSAEVWEKFWTWIRRQRWASFELLTVLRHKNGQRFLRNESLCVTNTSEVDNCQRQNWIYSKRQGMDTLPFSTGNRTSWPWAERIPHFTRLQCFGVNIQSPGVKLTPQLDQKKVCVSTLASMCAWVCMCVHTAVFLKWHIFSYSFSEENWLTPACVDILEVAHSGFSCVTK